jgi:hypothetical protein
MNPSKTRAKTVFCDIDGCIFKHTGSMTGIMLDLAIVLPGVIEKFNEWDGKGYNIVLTTGRKESSRAKTEKSLRDAGLFWDHLIMGLGGGPRVLINDIKPYDPNTPTATAINVVRDAGLGDVDI